MKVRKLLSVIASILFISSAQFSKAADIYISPAVGPIPERATYYGWGWSATDHMGCQIILNGTIQAGDLQKISKIYDTGLVYDDSGGEIAGAGPNICLNSSGGSLEEAIQISKYIKENHGSTIVPESARCESACAIIFMAGNIRGAPDRAIYQTSKLGVHAPKLQVRESNFKKEDISKAYDLAILSIAEITRLKILPAYLLEILATTPHSSMTYLNTIEDLTSTNTSLVTKSHRTNDHRSYEVFNKLPNHSVQEMAENICSYFFKERYDRAPEFGRSNYGQNSVDISVKAGRAETVEVEATVYIHTNEESYSACSTSITFSKLTAKLYDITVDYHEEQRRYNDVLLLWDKNIKIESIQKELMSHSDILKLINQHNMINKNINSDDIFECAIHESNAKIVNVQNFTNLRLQAGLDGGIIDRVPLGASVQISNPGSFLRYDRCAATCKGTNQSAIKRCIDNNDVWIEVQYNGRRGFLSRKFLK
jgi:hypothetical protein